MKMSSYKNHETFQNNIFGKSKHSKLALKLQEEKSVTISTCSQMLRLKYTIAIG